MSARCVILAAGEGRRLQPLTENVPKPMLPVANMPLLAHNLMLAAEFGMSSVGVNVHHAADVIMDAFGDGSTWGARITWRQEPVLTGPAGALHAFAGWLPEVPFVVMSGDALHTIDLVGLLDAHSRSGARLSVVVQEVDDAGRYGVATTDREGFVASFVEKPVAARGRRGLVSCGVYCVDPSLVAKIPRGCVYDFGAHLIPQLVAAGERVLAVEHEGYWLDIGTSETFRRANLDAVEGNIPLKTLAKVAPASGDPDRGPVLWGRCVRVGRRVEVVGPAVIGDGAVIGDDAAVHRSVLLKGAVVAPEMFVVDAVLGARQSRPGGP